MLSACLSADGTERLTLLSCVGPTCTQDDSLFEKEALVRGEHDDVHRRGGRGRGRSGRHHDRRYDDSGSDSDDYRGHGRSRSRGRGREGEREYGHRRRHRHHRKHSRGRERPRAPYFMGAGAALGAMPAVTGGGLGAGGYP